MWFGLGSVGAEKERKPILTRKTCKSKSAQVSDLQSDVYRNLFLV